MAKIGAVKLKKEESFELPPEGEVPRQFGEGRTNPYPGKYGFQLPHNIDEVYDRVETKVRDKEVERINANFDSGHPIVILATPSGEEHNQGSTFETRVSNVERARDKEKTKFVSDLYYLLVEGLGHDESDLRKKLAAAKAKKSNPNVVWAEALNTHAGETFGARVVWSARCREDATRYIEVDGRSVEDPDGEKGCGWKGYMRDIPKEEGRYLERFLCPQCEVASLRAFANLEGFYRWASEEAGEGG